MSRYRFTAEKTDFCGEDGYTVKQYDKENVVVEQFVLAECFENFCNAAGIKPEMI